MGDFRPELTFKPEMKYLRAYSGATYSDKCASSDGIIYPSIPCVPNNFLGGVFNKCLPDSQSDSGMKTYLSSLTCSDQSSVQSAFKTVTRKIPRNIISYLF